MLQRLDAMQSELSRLTDSLRTGANRLNAELQLLDGNFEEVRDAVDGRGRSESNEASSGVEVGSPGVEVGSPGVEVGSPGVEVDVDGARLVALNMALNGTSREETDRYLAINFGLGDRAQLLDEVYASVEG
jgi:hypothetical protein